MAAARASGLLCVALASGCGQKVLTVVDTCPDGSAFSSTVGCAPVGLLDDLIGWWRLDDAAGGIARDSSTRGNDGALVNLDPAMVWGSGRFGGALVVEGNGFVNVADSASIDSITDQVTISGWGYLDGDPTDEYSTIASRERATSLDQHFHIGFYKDRVPTTFIMTDGGTSIRKGPAAAPIKTWVHLATTYDGSVVRFYVDGQEVMNQGLTGGFAPDTTPFILGANGNGVGDANVTERFFGRIDEIMLYRRALSAGEIAQLHDGVLFGTGAASDGGAHD